ncbi:3-hydroxybutyryl-CoA dehydrogenase [Niastella vici]|uniref:3-hydroxybutyryl-CoA dehydrogenase n=1 Tax=Niastella vici TaxID=1703345 RepID=A0A1V9FS00_9BACT|nr:3-hydroxyacyl-CoA dehydrogenase family protein [Niastella vici]OQP61110.1 3-hydroxybutyryl-CoA dehydrogenase [Niastella vici]
MLKKIGIIGAGNIGSSMAVDLLLNGYHVKLVDVTDDALMAARIKIDQELKFALLMRGRSKENPNHEKLLADIEATTQMEDTEDCDLIIENVYEDWAVKEKVYRRLDQICPPHICFGVNTSCISVTKLAGVTSRRDKIVGVHFMNPVNLMPTVEVMRGIHTSDNTLDLIIQFLATLNKEAIVVQDFPGFVSNRISHLFINEAAFVYQDNVASARDIDKIFKKCFFHKMGPLETADLIGLDTVMKSIDVLYESYKDPKFRCCPVIRRMVDAGHLGRKTGKGFYDYNINLQ